MRCQFILKKFDLDLKILENKIKAVAKGQLSIDQITNRLEFIGDLDINKLNLDEIDTILIKEKDNSLLRFDDLRKGLLAIARKYNPINLKIEMYSRINITPISLKDRLIKYLTKESIKIGESDNNLLIEVFKDKSKIYYRIFSYNKMMGGNKNKYNGITVLIENPRLTEEISDFLRLCLIFNLKFKVIHNDKKQFEQMLNKAKTITKGKLSDFNVEVIKSLNDARNCIKVGFSKHAKSNENDFIKFLKENKNKNLLFIFGNDLYGLTQEARDKLDYCFSLTPDKIKPLKANQALSYVLGIYTTIN